MSLLNHLANQGISQEDLEQAAAVELFQKVASDEGIDLDAMSEDEIVNLYDHFQENVLPALASSDVEADVEAEVGQKIASLSEDDVVFLFHKQASAEGIDADDLVNVDDAVLAQAFENFQEEILPHMAMNDWEPVATEAAVKHAEASEKLAEADMLGRQMAASFYDELEKQASYAEAGKHVRNIYDSVKGARKAPGYAGEAIKGSLKGLATSDPAKHLAIGGGAGGVGMGAGYLAGRLKKRKADASKTASAFDALVEQRALELLAENGY